MARVNQKQARSEPRPTWRFDQMSGNVCHVYRNGQRVFTLYDPTLAAEIVRKMNGYPSRRARSLATMRARLDRLVSDLELYLVVLEEKRRARRHGSPWLRGAKRELVRARTSLLMVMDNIRLMTTYGDWR